MIAMLAMFANSANAAVIYSDNAGVAATPNDLQMSSNLYNPITETTTTASFTAVDDFTLGTDAILTGVNFWADTGTVTSVGPLEILPSDPANFAYTYTIYDNTGPGGTVVATNTATVVSSILTSSVSLSGVHVYEVTFDLITPLALSAGSTYWLELQGIADTSGAQTIAWTDFNGAVIGASSQQSVNGTYTGPIGADRAFELLGTPVPTPGTIFLLGLGLLGIARSVKK